MAQTQEHEEMIGEAEKEFSDSSDSTTLSILRQLEKQNDATALIQSINSFLEILRNPAHCNNGTKKSYRHDCVREIGIRLRRLSSIDRDAANRIRIDLNIEFDNAFLPN